MGKMAPSAALQDEPGSGSLARGRPHQFLRDLALLVYGLRQMSEAKSSLALKDPNSRDGREGAN